MITQRFAPSPTGPLHLGHAFSALTAHDRAHAAGGRFLLRIEDIDRSRARKEWETQIYDDLSWLGLRWETPVLRQSDRLSAYRAALETLWARGLIYVCTCRRRDIEAALAAPQEGTPLHGPDGLIYPGTCRPGAPVAGPMQAGGVLRLDMRRAVALAGPLSWDETGIAPASSATPDHMIHAVGDAVLARREMGTSYHLSVVLDDAEQGVSDVTRGVDLADATAIHVLLQKLLDLPTPRYHHHRLIRDEAGKRLAKRDDARAIRKYRQDGASPQDIRAMVGLGGAARSDPM